MRPDMKMRFPCVVLLFAVASIFSAHAATERGKMPPIPAADHAAIRNYPLTEDVIQRLLAVSADAKKAHIGKPWVFEQIYASSLDDVTDRVLTTEPRLARIVEKHGFSRREYMTAVFAAASARYVSVYGPDKVAVHDQFVASDNASEANIAFYRSHKAMLDPLLEQSDVGHVKRDL